MRALPATLVFLLIAGTPAEELLWANGTGNSYTVSSPHWTSPPADLEAADEFDVHGVITHVEVDASGCMNCSAPVVAGALVRFYQWNNGSIGAHLSSQFVRPGSDLLVDLAIG